MKAHERRMAILDALIVRGSEKIENLAFEFNVSRSSIKNDIFELSLSYPIYTETGRYGGGVYIDPNYRLGRKYLNDEELTLLQRLSISLSGKEKEIMQGLIKNFTQKR